jgi:hypothetical protein
MSSQCYKSRGRTSDGKINVAAIPSSPAGFPAGLLAKQAANTSLLLKQKDEELSLIKEELKALKKRILSEEEGENNDPNKRRRLNQD